MNMQFINDNILIFQIILLVIFLISLFVISMKMAIQFCELFIQTNYYKKLQRKIYRNLENELLSK